LKKNPKRKGKRGACIPRKAAEEEGRDGPRTHAKIVDPEQAPGSPWLSSLYPWLALG